MFACHSVCILCIRGPRVVPDAARVADSPTAPSACIICTAKEENDLVVHCVQEIQFLDTCSSVLSVLNVHCGERGHPVLRSIIVQLNSKRQGSYRTI